MRRELGVDANGPHKMLRGGQELKIQTDAIGKDRTAEIPQSPASAQPTEVYRKSAPRIVDALGVSVADVLAWAIVQRHMREAAALAHTLGPHPCLCEMVSTRRLIIGRSEQARVQHDAFDKRTRLIALAGVTAYERSSRHSLLLSRHASRQSEVSSHGRGPCSAGRQRSSVGAQQTRVPGRFR